MAAVTRSLQAVSDMKAEVESTVDIDPIVLQANTSEGRVFLMQHRDILTPSIQESTQVRWINLKRIYKACPQIVQSIILMVLLIIFFILIPTIIVAFFHVLSRRRIEVISIGAMLFAAWLTYIKFVRDV